MPQGRPSFEDVLAQNTGQQVPTQLWESGQTRLHELLRQTNHLADQLESQGIRARDDRTGIVVFGEVTGQIEVHRDFRPVRFLPLVAQRERQGMLNALMYFQANAPGGQYMRYAVVTAGERIPAHGSLRETITRLGRNISRWASEARQRYSIEVVYRGTEFTVDRDGTYHPHSNVLYIPRRKLAPGEWAEFLSWTRGRLGAHWQDCGKLSEPREALKYPFKPTDLVGRPQEEIGWLFNELFRMKLAQPLGAFKSFWKELDENKEKIGRLYGSGGGEAPLQRIRKQEREAAKKASTPPRWQENKLICRTAPQARFSPFMEPLTIVENYTDRPITDGGKLRLWQLEQRQAEAQRLWRENGAPEPTMIKRWRPDEELS